MKDNVSPLGKWQFDDAVTEVFDDMLQRSIPQYEVMRQSVFSIGAEFVKRDTQVVDLGCSRGEAIAPFVEKFGAYCRYIGIEISNSMFVASQARFQGLIDCGVMTLTQDDLRKGLPLRVQHPSLILSILTLQFIPIEYRQQLLTQCYERLDVGGALILVEKVLGNTAKLDDIFTRQYYQLKADNQYTQEQIAKKRQSLEGVLVPITAKWNEDLLHQAGFTIIDCFWRWGNFAGWIAIK